MTQEKEEDLYYIQHNNEPHENDLFLWWRPKSQGYTQDLDQAGLYTKDEAEEIFKIRRKDLPWPKSLIDSAVVRHVTRNSFNSAIAEEDRKLGSLLKIIEKEGEF